MNMSSHLNLKRRRHSMPAVISAKRVTSVIELRESTTQLKITDLLDDCLEHIFKFLDIKDLLSVADSRKSFKASLDRTFRSKYIKDFCIMPSDEGAYKWGVVKLKNYDREAVINFGDILKFLRCFGELISEIYFSTNLGERYPQNQNNELLRYMNKYCSKTLRGLSMVDAPNILLLKPFVNVESFRLHRESGDKWIDLERVFPKLCCLELSMESIPDYFAVHLPHLKELLLFGPNDVMKNVKKIVQLNLHVQLLTIYEVDDPSILEIVSECRQLKEFHIQFSILNYPSRNIIESLINRLPSLNKMTIEVKGLDMDDMDMLESSFANIHGWRVSKKYKMGMLKNRQIFGERKFITKGIEIIRNVD